MKLIYEKSSPGRRASVIPGYENLPTRKTCLSSAQRAAAAA
jgi:hypothetical protein